jgi:Trk-type K+ transport system membrane component
MLLVEPFGVGVLVFDVFSATCGVGWSMGVAEELTRWGQGVLAASVVVGRCLPMVAIAAWGRMCHTGGLESP